jgi:hypothetical protein
MNKSFRIYAKSARSGIVALALILLASAVLSAQAGWSTVKDRTGACQISVPPSWSMVPGSPGEFASPEHRMSVLISGYPRKAAPMTDVEKRELSVDKIIENSAERWLYTGKPRSDNTITYHVNVPAARRVCAAELTVKVGNSEDEIKKIAAAVGSSK